MSTVVTKSENAKTHPSVFELVGRSVSCYKHTHTHSPFILIHCDSPPWAEHQTSRPVAFSRPMCTTPLLLLLHSSILLHKDEGSLVVLPWLHKIPLASLQRWCCFIPQVEVLPLIGVCSFHQHWTPVTYITTIRAVQSLLTRKVLHFLKPLGPPMGTELHSCHLSDTNNFEKAPKYENF